MTARTLSHRHLQAVGVTIPVHNEEERLPSALQSLESACAEVEDSGLSLRVTLVLDACRDSSGAVARGWKWKVEGRSEYCVDVLECQFKNVGRARAVGCDALVRAFNKTPTEMIWLATTDADSRVPSGWLTAQLSEYQRGADAWVGRVSVSDWARHRRKTALRWQRDYEGEGRPIHGANLGFTADHYLGAGGFRALTSGEDRALVQALLHEGANVHFDSDTRVATSSRSDARAPEGFAAALKRIEATTSRYFANHRAPSTLDERAAG
jgi:hypothetical protein